MNNKEKSYDTELEKELENFLKDKDLLKFLKVFHQVRSKPGTSGLNCSLLAAMFIILIALGGFWIFQNPFQGMYRLLNNEIATIPDARPLNQNEKKNLFLWNTPGFPQIDRLQSKEPNNLVAVNFQPLGYMEEMVGMVTRAGLFHLVLPGKSSVFPVGDTIGFQWNVLHAAALELHILNSRGEAVFALDSIKGNTLTLSMHSLEDGLYYWKFLYQDNLVDVGKIFIRR